MKPSESAWNFVPISTALGSLSAPAGIVALLQMLHWTGAWRGPGGERPVEIGGHGVAGYVLHAAAALGAAADAAANPRGKGRQVVQRGRRIERRDARRDVVGHVSGDERVRTNRAPRSCWR